MEIFYSSALAGVDDIFAKEAGSVDLEELIALGEIIILTVQHDRWSPNRKWSCLILCLKIVFLQSWNVPVIGWFINKLCKRKIFNTIFDKRLKVCISNSCSPSQLSMYVSLRC